MNLSSVVSFAKSHPVPVALGVFVGGLVLYLLLSRQSAPASDNGAGAYYAAQSAQAASNNEVALGNINAAAAIGINQSNNDAAIKNNVTWAGVSMDNNDTQVALAPYQLQSNIVGAIGNLANAPVLTNTTANSKTKGGGGISLGYGGVGFGFSNGSKTTASSTQTQTANPAVLQALAQLQQLSTTYSAMH